MTSTTYRDETLELAPGRRRRRGHRTGKSSAWVLLLPFLLLFGGTYLAPIGYAVYLSLFTNKVSGLGLGPRKLHFIGLDNYTAVLADSAFRDGVLRVLLFGIVQVPGHAGTGAGPGLAAGLGPACCQAFFRLAFFVPYAIPGVIAAIMWGFLYAPRDQPHRQSAQAHGVRHGRLPGQPLVLWSIANISTWEWTGYNMLIIFAALQAIPARAVSRRPGSTAHRARRSPAQIKIPLVRAGPGPDRRLLDHRHAAAVHRAAGAPAITGNITSTYTPNLMRLHQRLRNNNYNYAPRSPCAGAGDRSVFSFGLLRADAAPSERE